MANDGDKEIYAAHAGMALTITSGGSVALELTPLDEPGNGKVVVHLTADTAERVRRLMRAAREISVDIEIASA